MNTRNILFLFVFSSALAACDDAATDTDSESMGSMGSMGSTSATSEGEGSTGAMTDVDPDAIAMQAVGFAAFERINDEPFASEHGLADTVNVWVPAEHADAYRTLSADTVFEPGTILVKEQLDADGQLGGMTVMFKGPADYAPDAGDWWFGLVSPEGEIMVGGQPSACVQCHTRVADTGFVFGL